jgi:hypothetical protein
MAGPAPREATDGPWTCSACGWENSALRTRWCRNCRAEAPAGGASIAAAVFGRLHQAGYQDWLDPTAGEDIETWRRRQREDALRAADDFIQGLLRGGRS